MSNVGIGMLQGVVEAAIAGTGATAGWLLALDGRELRVVAAAGEGALELLGRTIDSGSGPAGFATSSGQPLAIGAQSGEDRLAGGVAALLGRSPRNVVAVPCATADGVAGALEVIDKQGGSFTVDDLELTTLLGTIAAAGLVDVEGRPGVPTPAELGADLERLASEDPARYAALADVIAAVLSRG